MVKGLEPLTRVGWPAGLFLSVKNYGATGNGTTDDRAAIQAADAAAAAIGAAVYFPGTTNGYLVTGSVRPSSGVTWFGDGYKSQIKCPSAGWLLVATTNMGIVNIDNKSNVRISGLRITGTKDADLDHTPKLIYLEGTLSAPLENVSIINNDLDTTAFEGIWGGGSLTHTTQVRILGNRIKNVGHPAGVFVGLPAIQPNSNYTVIADNILDDVGYGIAGSAVYMVISGNLIRGVTAGGIGTGDNADGGVTTIISNVIEFTERVTGSARRGILLDGVSGTDHVINVIGNVVRVIGTSGIGDSECYKVGTAKHVNLIGNVAEIQVRGVGFSALGSTAGTNVTYKNNTVTIISENGASAGFKARPNGSGQTLNLISSGNNVYGISGETHSSYAFDYRAQGGGTLNSTSQGDFTSGGYIATGDSVIYQAANFNATNVPVYDRADLSLASAYLRNPEIGILSFIPAFESRAISGGIVDISGAQTSLSKRQTRLKIDTESEASTDDLDTINGLLDGDIIILQTADSARDVTVKHNTGNILCASDFTLTSTSDRMVLVYDGALGKCIELSRWSPTLNVATAYQIAGTKVVGARETGWTAMTGTANKGAYASYAGQDVSATYTEAEIQTIDDALKAATQRIKALEDMARTHGLIN